MHNTPNNDECYKYIHIVLYHHSFLNCNNELGSKPLNLSLDHDEENLQKLEFQLLKIQKKNKRNTWITA